MRKRLISLAVATAISTVNLNAYDYSVLSLQDRVGGIHNLIDSKLSSGNVTFDDFSNELKEMLGGNVKDVTDDGYNLLIEYNDDTSKNIEAKGNFLKSGDVLGDKMSLKLSDGEVVKVSLTPLIESFDSKLEAVRDSIPTDADEKTVKNIYVDEVEKNIVVTFTDNSTSKFGVANLVPDDKFTQSGAVSTADKALTLTLSDGSTLRIDLAPIFEQRDDRLDDKVDKVPGKGLSTNDLTDHLKMMISKRKMTKIYVDNAAETIIATYSDGATETIDLSNLLEFEENHVRSGRLSLGGESIVLIMKDGSEVSIDVERIYDAIDAKVSIEPGKGLSSNDFTDEYKDKVNAIKVVNTSYDSSTSELTTTYNDGTVDRAIITGTAITNYVTNGEFDVLRKNLNLTLLSGQVVEIDMSDVVTDKKTTKDVVLGADNKLEIKYTDGTNSFVELADLFVDEATYSPLTKKITFTKNDGTTFTVDLSTSFDAKVDRVNGMGLSANDYTNADKAEVAKIGDKVDRVNGMGLSNNNYTDADKDKVGEVDNKVDKIADKDLSTNDYTDADKAEVATIGDKVNKVNGKDLSSNDFTDNYKDKVDEVDSKVKKITGKGLSTNDYTDSDRGKVLTIDNKVDKVAGKGLSTNDLTDDLKSKVEARKVRNITRSGTVLIIHYTDGTTQNIQ